MNRIFLGTLLAASGLTQLADNNNGVCDTYNMAQCLMQVDFLTLTELQLVAEMINCQAQFCNLA